MEDVKLESEYMVWEKKIYFLFLKKENKEKKIMKKWQLWCGLFSLVNLEHDIPGHSFRAETLPSIFPCGQM